MHFFLEELGLSRAPNYNIFQMAGLYGDTTLF